MSRQTPFTSRLLAAVLVAISGCAPQQPFYFHHVDGDLAHYNGVATDVNYPDIDANPSSAKSPRPYSLQNKDANNYWT